MRIALVSDIHGNLAALEAVAADIRRRGADQVVNLGDNLSGPLLPRETAQWLMASGWVSLAGNHERQVLNLQPGRGSPSDQYARAQLTEAELAWMRTLVPAVALTDELFACHGSPRSDHEYLLETLDGVGLRLATQAEMGERLGPQAGRSVIVCGHTHVPRAARLGATLLVNPGSVGLQAYSDNHPHHHVVQTGAPDARYALITQRRGQWQAEHVTVPYRHEAMAQLAQQRGRPEWAHALRTGNMP